MRRTVRYADPALCPDCRSALPKGVPNCPTCGLLVRHRLAVELFSTLSRADDLVAELRSVSSSAVAATASAPAAAPLTPPAPPAVAAAPATPPAPAAPAGPSPAAPYPPARTGVRFASVPKILLGLGALCLLAAAVIFLAVSWSALGVGGRTAVLVTFTLTAGGAALWLDRLELRIAAESLITVALGLLTLDVLGAQSAGWFGDAGTDVAVLAAGLVLLLASTGAALHNPADRTRLIAPQVTAGVGALMAYVGALQVTSNELVVGHTTVALLAAGAWFAHRVGLTVQMWSLAVVAGLAGLLTAMNGFVSALEHPDLAALWLDGPGWSLLGTASSLLLPGLVRRDRDLLQLGGNGSALVVTTALTLPCVDTSAETVGAVALGVTAAWTLAYRLLPASLRVVAITPAVLGSLILALLTAITGAVAAARVVEVGGPYAAGPGVRLVGPSPVTEPLLTVPSVLMVVALVVFLVPARPDGSTRFPWRPVGAVAGGLAAVATLASYDVPLATVVGALGVLAIGLLVWSLLRSGNEATALGVSAGAITALALVPAVPSAELSAIAAGLLAGVALTGHLVGRTDTLRDIAGLGIAPALALLVWAGSAVADVDVAWRGVPLLLVVGVAALARPRLEVEVPALVVGFLGVQAPIVDAADRGGSLALHLTVAGCLFSASALLHTSRRPLAWAGGGLLLLATWVRLADLEVTAPEPYTLPLATFLVVIGVLHLRRDAQASTAAALTPGLLLATVPSLLWVLDDPLSVRAVGLGLGCLALTLAGAVLRWSSPLVVGATVGSIVVLREVGPYAGEVPQWVWIGLAGALLITVGISWERRLLEVRQAVGLLGRLR